MRNILVKNVKILRKGETAKRIWYNQITEYQKIYRERRILMNSVYEIIPVNPGTYRIEEANVRFFLLTGTKEALLIDSGMQVTNARDIAESLTDLPLKLLNTHADPDHIRSNGQFSSFYMNPAEASNYYRVQKGAGIIDPVEHGSIIDLGERPLEIISLPGHTPGSIAVLDINHRVLISGDPIQDGAIYMFGQQRELHAYLLSLQKLQKYCERFDIIYPSHGSFPVSPDLIPLLYEGAENILNKKIAGVRTQVHGRPVIRYDIGAAAFLCDAEPEQDA